MFGLAITDLRWHSQMLAEQPIGVVNFWTPTPWKVSLPPQSRLGFMLKSPIRKIGGFGYVQTYEEATVDEAWERWGPANGVSSRAELDERIREFASKRSTAPIGEDHKIGCLILEDCTFAEADDQYSPEELGLSFPRQIVKWKSFPGELILPFEKLLPNDSSFELVSNPDIDWTVSRRKRRLAQSQFRRTVLAAYDRSCAVTGADCSEVLQAAHIQPFRSLDSHHVQNGIALRSDIHTLFDAGLISFEDDGEVMVSPRLSGSAYNALRGKRLALPKDSLAAPSPAALKHHREFVFRAS